MFLDGLSSLVFWMLLVVAVFAVMRWSAWGRQAAAGTDAAISAANTTGLSLSQTS